MVEHKQHSVDPCNNVVISLKLLIEVYTVRKARKIDKEINKDNEVTFLILGQLSKSNRNEIQGNITIIKN